MRDPYLYEDTDVLKNKLDIKEQDLLDDAEADYVVYRLKELAMNPLEGKYDLEHLMEMHRYTFQDLYESDYRNLHPVPFVATSLPALQAAGINPQEINVTGLLDPTNVGTMQHISERVLNDFALGYNPSEANSLDKV